MSAGPTLTLELARELYTHQEWADALIWRAALGSEVARVDDQLRERLFHIHLTQRAFLKIWTQQKLDRYSDLNFDTLPVLFDFIRPYYDAVQQYLAALPAEALTAPMHVPWVKLFTKAVGQAPVTTTLQETIIQVPAHSTYHRGQVNTRLRMLGAEPPMVDYIAWVWLGKPAPAWPDA